MRLRLGKYQISINSLRKEEINQNLTYSDFKEVNQSHLDYINSLSDQEIKNRINSVSVNDLNTIENCDKAQKLLKEEGIFIVPNFLPKTFKESLVKETKKTFLDIDELIDSFQGYHEDENLAIQKEDIRFKSYSKLANYKKPVVCVRQGQDQGMIDVFNYDKLPKLNELNIKNHFNESGLNGILNKYNNKELSLSLVNMYINRGITQTRGFHIDGLSNTLKAFVYLSDVESLSDGPYCFCKGTHLPGAFRKTNQALSLKAPNKTESPLVPVDSIIPVLAKSGSLVVSNQTGIHRGIPQRDTAERLLLVARYL